MRSPPWKIQEGRQSQLYLLLLVKLTIIVSSIAETPMPGYRHEANRHSSRPLSRKCSALGFRQRRCTGSSRGIALSRKGERDFGFLVSDYLAPMSIWFVYLGSGQRQRRRAVNNDSRGPSNVISDESQYERCEMKILCIFLFVALTLEDHKSHLLALLRGEETSHYLSQVLVFIIIQQFRVVSC